MLIWISFSVEGHGNFSYSLQPNKYAKHMSAVHSARGSLIFEMILFPDGDNLISEFCSFISDQKTAPLHNFLYSVCVCYICYGCTEWFKMTFQVLILRFGQRFSPERLSIAPSLAFRTPSRLCPQTRFQCLVCLLHILAAHSNCFCKAEVRSTVPHHIHSA